MTAWWQSLGWATLAIALAFLVALDGIDNFSAPIAFVESVAAMFPVLFAMYEYQRWERERPR